MPAITTLNPPAVPADLPDSAPVAPPVQPQEQPSPFPSPFNLAPIRVHGRPFDFGTPLDPVTSGPPGCPCDACGSRRLVWERGQSHRTRLAAIALKATQVAAALGEKARTGRIPVCRGCSKCVLPICPVCRACTARNVTAEQFQTYMLLNERQEPEDYTPVLLDLRRTHSTLDELGAMRQYLRNRAEVCCSCNICGHCSEPMNNDTYCRECGQHVGCTTSNGCRCTTCTACNRRRAWTAPAVACEHCKGVISCCCRCNRCGRCNDVQPSSIRGPQGDLLANRCQNCGFCLTCCRCAAVNEAELPMPDANRPDRRGVVYQRAIPKFWPPSPSWGLVEAGVAHPSQLNPYKRFIGQEIEVGGNGTLNMNRIVVKTWKGAIVSDGSLPESGFEINTAPAGGDMFVRQIREIVAECERTGAWVNYCCGLHTHVDTSDFNIWAMRRLINLYRRVEPHMYSLLPKYRQDNHYCEKCGDNWWKVFNDPGKVRELKGRTSGNHNLDKGAPVRTLKGKLTKALYNRDLPGQGKGPGYVISGGDTAKREAAALVARKRNKANDLRYRGLNVHSWMLRGTLEFRMGAPAVDITTNTGGYDRNQQESGRAPITGDYIVNWGVLCASVVEAAAKWSDSQVDRFGHTTRDSASCTWEDFRDGVLPSSLRKWADETREFIKAQRR